jgi:coenzyme F420-reducing hydrogenase beta subunit
MNQIRRSPRIQVTLSDEVMAMLHELSELTGQSKGGMVSEIMTEALPALRAARDAVLIVKDSPREAQALLARFSNEAVLMLAQSQLEFDDLLDDKPKTKRTRVKKGMADDRPS